MFTRPDCRNKGYKKQREKQITHLKNFVWGKRVLRGVSVLYQNLKIKNRSTETAEGQESIGFKQYFSAYNYIKKSVMHQHYGFFDVKGLKI